MDIEELKKSREQRTIEPLPIPAKELSERYEALFTAAVNDVLRERGLLYQTLPHNIMALQDGMKVAGECFTIKGGKSLEIKNEMEERAIMLESIPADSVVAWDTGGDDESAQWGEVMTMAAKNRGCRGAVVDGGVRDVDRVLPQNFPLFIKFRSSNGMLGRFRISGWQVPIRIGDVNIDPGDIIFADMDGAIVVPRKMAVEVLERAERIQQEENDIVKWVKSGMPPREVVKRGGYF